MNLYNYAVHLVYIFLETVMRIGECFEVNTSPQVLYYLCERDI